MPIEVKNADEIIQMIVEALSDLDCSYGFIAKIANQVLPNKVVPDGEGLFRIQVSPSHCPRCGEILVKDRCPDVNCPHNKRTKVSAKVCKKCGSKLLTSGLCKDKTCPYSDHQQWAVWKEG